MKPALRLLALLLTVGTGEAAHAEGWFGRAVETARAVESFRAADRWVHGTSEAQGHSSYGDFERARGNFAGGALLDWARGARGQKARGAGDYVEPERGGSATSAASAASAAKAEGPAPRLRNPRTLRSHLRRLGRLLHLHRAKPDQAEAAVEARAPRAPQGSAEERALRRYEKYWTKLDAAIRRGKLPSNAFATAPVLGVKVGGGVGVQGSVGVFDVVDGRGMERKVLQVGGGVNVGSVGASVSASAVALDNRRGTTTPALTIGARGVAELSPGVGFRGHLERDLRGTLATGVGFVLGKQYGLGGELNVTTHIPLGRGKPGPVRQIVDQGLEAVARARQSPGGATMKQLRALRQETHRLLQQAHSTDQPMSSRTWFAPKK